MFIVKFSSFIEVAAMFVTLALGICAAWPIWWSLVTLAERRRLASAVSQPGGRAHKSRFRRTDPKFTFGFAVFIPALLIAELSFNFGVGPSLDRWLRNRVSKEITEGSLQVTDARYCAEIVGSFDFLSSEIEHNIGEQGAGRRTDQNFQPIEANKIRISCQCLQQGQCTIDLEGNLRFDSRHFPDDIGQKAEWESDALLTLLLNLVSPRATHFERIVYSAVDNDDFGERISYESVVAPSDYVIHKPEFADAGTYVRSRKQVLHDNASGKMWGSKPQRSPKTGH